MRDLLFQRLSSAVCGVVLLLALIVGDAARVDGQSLRTANSEEFVTVEVMRYRGSGKIRCMWHAGMPGPNGWITVTADTLTALYRGVNGASDVYRLEAIGNVVIASDKQTDMASGRFMI